MRLQLIRWQGEGPEARRDEWRAVLESEGFAVFEYGDAPGVSYEPHQHDEDESLWLLSGEMSFEIEGQRYDLAAGDRLMLPARTIHSALAGARGATYLVGQREVRT